MLKLFIRILRKVYLVLIVGGISVIFFLGYNTYLVDRSLVNLKISLDKVNKLKSIEDARVLNSILDYSLIAEVSSDQSQAINLSKIEMAKDALKQSTDIKQLDTVKFALNEVINEKEKARSPVLKVLDKVTNVFVTKVSEAPRVKLIDQANFIRQRISGLTNKDDIQGAYYELAAVYMKASDFEKAKEAYGEVIKINPDNKLADKSKFNIAWIDKFQGNFDDAIKGFENYAKESTQKDMAAYSNYQIAETLAIKGDYAKAAEAYLQVSKQAQGEDNNLSELAQLRAGNVYLYDLKEYDKAKDIFDKVKQETPAGSKISDFVNKSAIPGVVGQYRKDGYMLLGQGRKLSDPQKYREALVKFDQALAMDVNDGVSYTGKALAYLWLDDPDRALDFARRAVKLLPNDEVASVNLGYIYIELGIVDEAIVEYKRFIAVNPFTSRSYYNLGYAYILKNRLDDAVVAFNNATRINPSFALAYNNLGWCHWNMNQYAQAIDAFEKAISINPNLTDALFNVGLVYRTMGRYADAKKKFEAVIRLNNDYPDANTYLNDVEKNINYK